MEKDELLPCPFCGGEGLIYKLRPWYMAYCANKDKCGASHPCYRTKRTAIKKWNTRQEAHVSKQ